MTEPRLPYRDRREAGRVLAQALQPWRGRSGLLVLALPRGGVAVGFEVAHALEAPLDVFIVRKLGYPGHEEYAMGAIASGGVRVMNPLPGMDVTAEAVARVVEREQAELARREQLYRGDRPRIDVRGRTVIVVDDGLATGSTMRAAVMAIRRQGPAHLAIAVPVGAPQTCRSLRKDADELVCPAMPDPFRAVGLWYRDFPQATDQEVRELLDEARREQAAALH
ncbi:MAG TPA: phosphoribosyltransferase [Ramlibacter sp.]